MQFSLRTLMIAMLAIAVLCALVVSIPGWLTGMVFASAMALMPAAIVAGIVYGGGERRAFAIGCATSYLACLFMVRGSWGLWFSNAGQILAAVTISAVVIPLGGVISVLTRHWLQDRR